MGPSFRALSVLFLLGTTGAQQIVETVGPYTYYGCETEAGEYGPIRTLPDAHTVYANMTLESCASDCAGYTFFGTEYGDECTSPLFSFVRNMSFHINYASADSG